MPARTASPAAATMACAGLGTRARYQSTCHRGHRQAAPPPPPPEPASNSCGGPSSSRSQPGHMRKVLEEDSHVRDRFGPHQFLVHIGVPCQLLDVAIATNGHETLAAAIVGIPVPLHDAKNP